MTKRKKANPAEGNPFAEGFLEWMDSPEGELSGEVMDTVFAVLDAVAVDAKARQLIWPDGQRLSIDESVQRIHADYSQFSAEQLRRSAKSVRGRSGELGQFGDAFLRAIWNRI